MNFPEGSGSPSPNDSLDRVRTKLAPGFAGITDFTLRGLVVELAECGVKVDYRTVWNFVHGERLSFKKKRSAR
jgi:transposase